MPSAEAMMADSEIAFERLMEAPEIQVEAPRSPAVDDAE